MARLRRIWPNDAMGDEGPCVIAWKYDPKGKTPRKEAGHKPIIGCCLEVGSISARSMQWQDYWLTTEITEILERDGKYWKFKTKNSTYEFWE